MARLILDSITLSLIVPGAILVARGSLWALAVIMVQVVCISLGALGREPGAKA